MNKIKLVCIIDDDPAYIYILRKNMEISEFCHETIIFHDGSSALKKLNELLTLKQDFPEVIFVDLNMPIMDGLDLIIELSKFNIPSNTQIYLASAQDGISNEIQNTLLLTKQLNLFTINKPVKINNLEEITLRHKELNNN